jgi:hypothetical protein
VWSGKVYPFSEGLNSGIACHYSVQNLFSSDLLFKGMKIKIYIITILPVVLYGFKTWARELREERRLRVFENWVLRSWA